MREEEEERRNLKKKAASFLLPSLSPASSHLVSVPERAVSADSGAVAVASVVVEVPAAAAASRPVPGDGDGVDDDARDEEAVVPPAAVRVGPSPGPEVRGPVAGRARRGEKERKMRAVGRIE